MTDNKKRIEYIDGRPVPMYRISGRDEMVELAKKGAISWEYGAFTESANAAFGCRGRTWENEYLTRPDKLQYTKQSFDVYENYCQIIGKEHGLNSNSNVIEFGCALGRNLVEAFNRYRCKVTGIDISQEAIDKCKTIFSADGIERGVFYKANLRNLDVLKQFDDDQFDLGICDHFLMCIAAGEEKRISEILRICKGVWFHELLGDPQSDYGEANGVHSGEDLSIYDNRLVTVKDLGDNDSPCLIENTFYTSNRPVKTNSRGTRFYVYKK